MMKFETRFKIDLRLALLFFGGHTLALAGAELEAEKAKRISATTLDSLHNNNIYKKFQFVLFNEPNIPTKNPKAIERAIPFSRQTQNTTGDYTAVFWDGKKTHGDAFYNVDPVDLAADLDKSGACSIHFESNSKAELLTLLKTTEFQKITFSLVAGPLMSPSDDSFKTLLTLPIAERVVKEKRLVDGKIQEFELGKITSISCELNVPESQQPGIRIADIEKIFGRHAKFTMSDVP